MPWGCCIAVKLSRSQSVQRQMLGTVLLGTGLKDHESCGDRSPSSDYSDAESRAPVPPIFSRDVQ